MSIKQINKPKHSNDRVYSEDGDAPSLNTMGGGMRQPFVKLEKVGEVKIVAKKRSHDTPKEINEYLKQSKGNMTISKISEYLGLPKTQVEHYFRADKYRAIPSPDVWNQLKKLLNFDDTYDTQVTSIYEKEVEFESSRRVYSDKGLSPTIDSTKKGGFITMHTTQPRSGNPSQGGTGPLSRNDGNTYCLDTGNSQAVELNHNIRRLTPVECCRLQGFPDDWNENGIIDGEIVEISDTQRYKQCGNAVTVDVVQAVAERIYAEETNPKNISPKP
jgi:site-specific DNA-cytosine methylase